MSVRLRTVRKGIVTMNHRRYQPDGQPPYDGRFEGMRLAFGDYPKGDDYEPFICLWGSQEMFNAHTEDEIEQAPYIRGGLDVDGKTILWPWWKEIR